MPPGQTGILQNNGCVAGKTSSHRPKPSGPTRPFLQPTGMLLCATSCQNWSVKKKRPLSVSPILCSRVQSDRRGAQSPQKIQLVIFIAEAVWDSIVVVSSLICAGFALHSAWISQLLGFSLCIALVVDLQLCIQLDRLCLWIWCYVL